MPIPLSPSDIWRIQRVQGSHRVGIRAGISVLVPLLLLVLTGHAAWAPYASFGAFTSLYGRAHEHLVRFQMQLSAAVMLTAAVVTGVLTSLATQDEWLLVATAAVIAATGHLIAKAHHYHPPGPLFLIFAYGAVSSMRHTSGDILIAALVAGASAAFAVLVGVAGVLRDWRHLRRHWGEAYLLRIEFQPSRQALWIGLGVALAGGIAAALHIGHPYWAMVSAIAPLTAPHLTSQLVRGIHRTLGTSAGLLTSWAVLSLPLGAPQLVVVGALLQVGAEMVVGRNYGLAMLLITPLALTMGQIAGPRPIGELLFDRGVETVIGSTVGMAIAILGHLLLRRRVARAKAAAGPDADTPHGSPRAEGVDGLG